MLDKSQAEKPSFQQRLKESYSKGELAYALAYVIIHEDITFLCRLSADIDIEKSYDSDLLDTHIAYVRSHRRIVLR